MTQYMEPVLEGLILGLDHTAIVVADLDDAIPRWVRLTGAKLESRNVVRTQRVEIAMLEVNGGRLELIRPIDSTSGVARFLATRGECLHHVAIQVSNIEAALDRLQEINFELIDSRARPGTHGLVAFVHPRSTGGVLVELIELSSPQL
jgi:methylmalonyl-CoA epimerase